MLSKMGLHKSSYYVAAFKILTWILLEMQITVIIHCSLSGAFVRLFVRFVCVLHFMVVTLDRWIATWP